MKARSREKAIQSYISYLIAYYDFLFGSFYRNTGVKLFITKFKRLTFKKYFSKIIETIICWYQNSL